nr:hypothetical protein [Tanacetum cinerariifolium]
MLNINMKTYQYSAPENESCPQDSWRYLLCHVASKGGAAWFEGICRLELYHIVTAQRSEPKQNEEQQVTTTIRTVAVLATTRQMGCDVFSLGNR